MGVQRTKFHSAIQSPPQQHHHVTAIIEPTLGLNVAQPLTDLRPGETPSSQNFVLEDGYITPRSGLSQWGTTGFTNMVLGVVPRDAYWNQNQGVLAMSTATDRLRNEDTEWVDSNGIASSTDTYNYYHGTQVVGGVHANARAAGIVLSNGTLTPRTLNIGSAGIQEYDAFFSIASYVKYVTVHDDRVVLFNSSNTNLSENWDHPTRVIWTARSTESDFANGGFEDLVMAGIGTGIVSERDRLALLSSHEVWAGRPRRDAYAFDFFPVDKTKGCPIKFHRTPQNTEAGTIWLGAGQQFYRLIGNEVRPIGDKIRDLLDTEMREWDHCWSFYNSKDNTYGLFYSDTTGEYPTKALFLRTDSITPTRESGGLRDDGAWLLQDFGSVQLTAGAVVNDNTVVFSSTGTAYRLLSTQTNDDGTAIDARWRSHALSNDRNHTNHLAITEAWLDVEESTSTQTTGFHYTTDRGDAFTDAGDFVTSNETPFDFLPLTSPAARQPQFELRIDDGSQPKIGRIQLTLREYTGRHRG